MTTPLFVLPSPTKPDFAKNVVKTHTRSASVDKFPLLHTKPLGDPLHEVILTPVEDDEEVLAETLLHSAVRRSRAQAHVRQRLQTLQYEEWIRINESLYTGPNGTGDGGTFTPEINGLGTLCPFNWRLVLTSDVYGVVDRTWLHEVNPTVFNESGILRNEYWGSEKPESIPWLYWCWLKGEFVDAGEFAEGWIRGEPTLLWLERWILGELTQREVFGVGRTGFLLRCEEKEFDVDEHVELKMMGTSFSALM